MTIPIIYNLRSIKLRWKSALIAIFAIAGVVAVITAVLSLIHGFRQTLISSGSPVNAIILRGGASAEMESAITLEQVKIIGDAPGVMHGADNKPIMSPEVVVVAAFPLRKYGTDANVQVRGVSEQALAVRENVKISRGRFFQAGLAELVVGKNASETYSGFELGKKVNFGGGEWTVVGVFDSGGTAFDSEVWCDANVLNQIYKRPENIFQSVTLKLVSHSVRIEPGSILQSLIFEIYPSKALVQETEFEAFTRFLSADPRLTVKSSLEIQYYEKQSGVVTKLIRVLGFLVASVMALGAVFGALNTMYSAVSARSSEIATLRAIGFQGSSIILSFILESLLLGCIGGIIGLILILPINGQIASTMNWQTFSHLSFSFRITPGIALQSLFFALFIGFTGGLLPAVRSARMPVAVALRGL
jgi:putative ABC transport system permease protein